MYLFFDTETTGFGAANIIQLAFLLTDENGNTIEEFNELIKPEGWEMPSIKKFIREGKSKQEAKDRAKFWIDNGYTNENSINNGIPIYDALRKFQETLKHSKWKIAHNIKFDNNIILVEMQRKNITKELFLFKRSFCTMLSTVDICKLEGRYKNKYKWPKLQELHKFLFDAGFDDAHDAMADVNALKKCFFKLKEDYKLYS